MSLQVTFDLPTEVEEKLRRESPDLDADVKETYALELFRRGKLTHCKLSSVLGLDRFATDAYLKQIQDFKSTGNQQPDQAASRENKKPPSVIEKLLDGVVMDN